MLSLAHNSDGVKELVTNNYSSFQQTPFQMPLAGLLLLVSSARKRYFNPRTVKLIIIYSVCLGDEKVFA